MDPRLQRRVQRYGWDRAAGHYEHFWSAQLEPAQRLLLEMAALRPGERVLDVACGTGLVSFPVARAVLPEGSLLGTDISQVMVDTAGELAEAEGLSNASFERMDAEALDLPDDSFDAALCALGLMYVPDPVQSFAEMRRVVEPGGRVVAAVWGARKSCGWAEIFPIVDSRVESEVCPLFFQLGTGDAMVEAMQRAELTDTTSERIRTVLHYESADAALGAAFVAGPVALAYSRFDEATREEAHGEYLASIEPWRQGEGYEIPGEFVVARGVSP
jgi:ubiquinone/menaquinone biosynthesis C-methylase UbiE